ncbi:hypothetical protein QBC37DRAFT_102453 [Rhypophila decipiens]|uniref:Uncharacterized protein n=1 Tax=Rhypophila decipiens TaxID=261697 RepID=A0AAN6XUH0_9PEZI|nr:hypothetical protein QBC37DRAFT_102453 [Rhypophila decipiens]
MSRETCMIFIDDSNVWIEAQKFAASGNSHMPKLEDTERDPRLRIDIGKLVESLRKNRIQGPSFLYGSRPPPNDSVWEAFQKNKFETNIYDRAIQSGKEKEVDNSMSADMSEKATELRVRAEIGGPKEKLKKENTTFVVITGDRDMLPAVKKIILKCQIRVELWAWKSGISSEYLKLLSDNSDLFSLNLLDSIFQGICFTAFRSTRKVKSVVGGRTIVLCDIADRETENYVCDRLLATCQLFWTTRFDGEVDLCVEFPRVDQIEKMILQARHLLPDIKVLSWPEYRARFNKDLKGSTISRNTYELLEEPRGAPVKVLGKKPDVDDFRVTSGSISESLQKMTLNEPTPSMTNSNPTNLTAEEGSAEWKTIINKHSDQEKRHRRIVNQKQNCPYGLRCFNREECTYRHSDEEMRIFRQNPASSSQRTNNLRLHKTKMCRHAGYCNRGRECLFAHSEEEARCLDCKRTGHFAGDTSGKCLLQT